jgi:DNA-binding response OmpR family regulator
VHDEPDTCAVLTDALHDEGFAVVPAADLKDAAAQARECAPDLVILALLRQSLDEQALMHLHRKAALCELPVVVLRGSSPATEQDIDTLLEHVWRTINARVLTRSSKA